MHYEYDDLYFLVTERSHREGNIAIFLSLNNMSEDSGSSDSEGDSEGCGGIGSGGSGGGVTGGGVGGSGASGGGGAGTVGDVGGSVGGANGSIEISSIEVGEAVGTTAQAAVVATTENDLVIDESEEIRVARSKRESRSSVRSLHWEVSEHRLLCLNMFCKPQKSPMIDVRAPRTLTRSPSERKSAMT